MAKYLATSPEHVQTRPQLSFGKRMLGSRRARVIGWTGLAIILGALAVATILAHGAGSL